MSRDFVKNTSNLMDLGTNTIGVLLNGAAQVSFHCIVTVDVLDPGGNDNALFHSTMGAGSSAVLAGMPTFGNLLIGGRSQAADSFQSAISTTDLDTGITYYLGGVLDYANDRIRVYVNGVQETDSAVTFGASAYTHTTSTTAPDRIGARSNASPAANEQLDGRLAELAIWTTDIGTDGFVALRAKYSPHAIHIPWNKLAVYLPLLGNTSPEIELRNGKVGTITGTIAKGEHPRMIYPKRRMMMFDESAADPGPTPTPPVGGRGHRLRRFWLSKRI